MSRIKDGDWSLLDYDFQTGTSKWIMYHGDGSYTIRADQPMDRVLEQNKEDLNASAGRRWGEGQRTASVPTHIYDKYLRQARLEGDHAYVKKWLNDSDNRMYRTFGGRI
jgi:hypothetical protein